MFSAASIATMTACIFLFGLFFSLLINFRYIVKNAEEGVAVTVLFDDGVDQATINSIGEQIKAYKGVTKVEYVSAEEAWDEWSKQYFGDTELESEMAEGFKNDNPLANSSSYSVYVDKIEHQDALVKYIEGLDGVREVNQLKGATQTLSSFNTLLTYISVAIILILLCVAVFLISNTVAIGISIRKEEIGIMKLIGATNFFVRAPFLIEGMIIGLIGAIIPLVLLFVMYKKVIEYVLTKFSMLSSVVQFMSVTQVFEVLTPGGADPWYGYRTVRKCDHDPQTSESLINNEREIKMPSPKVIGNNTKGDAAGKRQPPLYMNEFLQKLRNCRRRQ